MKQFDEMYAALPDRADAASKGELRGHYEAYAAWLSQQSESKMLARRAEAELVFRRDDTSFCGVDCISATAPHSLSTTRRARL